MATPTHDIRNWLKLNLLIDKACLVLRQLFQKSWETRFGRQWRGTKNDINVILAETQMKNSGKLQRKTILTGDVNSWDLTTLRAILTSKDFLNLTVKQARNIHKLANIRNQLAHSGSKGISDDELNAHWRTVSAILVQFGESEADLELLKQESRVGGVEFIKKEEPINDESTVEAQRLKEAGNAQFKMENWADSIKIYTQAILLPGLPSADRATLYSNRSVAFLKQKKLNLGLEDAKKAIELWPEWWRGHYRMGQVYTEMNKYKKAEECFDEAFAREPHREEINEARSYARMKRGQLDRNDVMDAHFISKSLDEAISESLCRTTSQINADTIKKELHSNVNNEFLQNCLDLQAGDNCQTGADGYPRDYGVAAQYYKKAADRGSALGLCMLARLTMEGKGVKRDMQLGISMLKQAAEKPLVVDGFENVGVAEAEHALGLYYEKGIGVMTDDLAAIDWYKKACEHRSVTAANNLGLIYRKKGNLIKEEQYLKMAANAGYARAMVNLADYYCSQGNAELALTWCQRARNLGEFGTQIDHFEKSSEDEILKFKASGVEEWESKNAKDATGLSIKERMERYLCQSDPHMADGIKLLHEFGKQVAKNKDEIYRLSATFPPYQLEMYAKRSLYARELWKAQNHFFNAMLAIMDVGLSNCSPMALCETFITELSSCAKIEFIVATIPMEWRKQSHSLVDHLLTMKTTFHEDTCVCYVALNGLSSLESTLTFLNECVRKYPQNVYFVEKRGQLYAFLERYEDGIRDINAAIKLEPSRYDLLYARAAMMRLFSPMVSAEATIAAYKEFLAVAPEDHRKVPESYYGMAQMCICRKDASVKANREICMSEAKHFFNLGVEAEGKQLPFFLPYESGVKSYVEIMIKSMAISKLRKEQQSGVVNSSKPQDADPGLANLTEHQAHKAGKSMMGKQDRVFRPALSDPSRENILRDFRRHMSALSTQYSPGQSLSINSFQPRMVQKSANSIIGLNAITLNEMDHRQDKIYNGYVLAVTIIEDVVFMASMQTIIEDSSGDVLLCSIYNWPRAGDQVTAREEFGIGCKISIINPYMRLAVSGESMIRVDDPSSIVFHGFLEKMCRYCCKPNASKSCAKCKASYCDKQCQMLDWKRDHKLICGINA